MKTALRLIIIAVLVFVSGSLFAEEKKQEIFSGKQPSIESFEITPNPVGRGDLFTMTIVVNHDNSSNVEFPLKELPESLLLWRGPYVRSFIHTDRDGFTTKKVRITVTFKPQSSGRMIIPPLSVFVDSKRFETEPRLLNVGLYKSRKLYIPLEVEWQSGFEKIYAGEAVPIYLMVMNQEVVTLFDQVRVAVPRGGFFEQARGVGAISSISEGDIILYDIPAAAYIYTIPVAGEVKIPSAGVDSNGITGWTDNLFLEVNRIPNEIKDSGAVGIFSFSTAVDRDRVEAGGDIVLTCTVSGDGNLNYLKLPVPETMGCLLVSTEEVENYSQSSYGFSGSKTLRWTYNAESPGTAVVSVAGFSFLNKMTDEVESFSEKEYRITVNEAILKNLDAEVEKFPFEKIALEEARVWKNHYRDYFRYIWLFPGLVFYLFMRILKGRRLFLAGVLTVIIMIAAISAGQFLLRSADDEAAEVLSAGEWYNDGLDQYHSGILTMAIHELRSAIYLDPVNSEYRAALDWIENENGFVNSIQPSIKMHPDIFYIILIWVINLFFLIAVLKHLRPGGFISALLILFGFVTLFSASMILYSDVRRQNLTAVICGDEVFLKKIPRESAETWMPVVSGTAIRIIDDSESFILIETGLGVKGWIKESFVLLDRPVYVENK